MIFLQGDSLVKKEFFVITVDKGGSESGLMTVPETASYLRLKISTIRAWILKHKVPYVKLGGRVFILKTDVRALIERSVVPVISS